MALEHSPRNQSDVMTRRIQVLRSRIRWFHTLRLLQCAGYGSHPVINSLKSTLTPVGDVISAWVTGLCIQMPYRSSAKRRNVLRRLCTSALLAVAC
jgi:hypothetical protein